MSVRKLFLPVGIVAALPLSLYFYPLGLWLKGHSAVYAVVIMIFLVNGLEFSTEGTKFTRRSILLLLSAAFLALVLAPVLGLLVGVVLKLKTEFSYGLVVICAMPTTLSSAIVITGVCGGNRIRALFLTIGINMLAIVSIPLVLPYLIGYEGGVRIDPLILFGKMLFLVLLPFSVGYCMRRMVRLPALVASYFPSAGVVLLVFIALSTAREHIVSIEFSQVSVLFLGVIVAHLLLLCAGAWLGGRVCHSIEDGIAFSLCCAQKTLPLAITVLAAVGLGDGFVLISCLMYYFFQLFIDNFAAHHVNCLIGRHGK